MSISGTKRPFSAVYHQSIEWQNTGGPGCGEISATVDKTAFAATTYLLYIDQYDQASEIICSGACTTFGGQVAVLLNDTKNGDTGVWAVEFESIKLPMLATDAPTVGTLIYWDETNSRCTTTASTHKLIGYALAAKETFAANNAAKKTPLTFIRIRKSATL